MMLGVALDDNGERNGQCDKQRMIPSRIVTALYSHAYISVYSFNTGTLHFPCNNHQYFHDIAWQESWLISPQDHQLYVKASTGSMTQATFVA